jgi:hypothetical protein
VENFIATVKCYNKENEKAYQRTIWVRAKNENDAHYKVLKEAKEDPDFQSIALLDRARNYTG